MHWIRRRLTDLGVLIARPADPDLRLLCDLLRPVQPEHARSDRSRYPANIGQRAELRDTQAIHAKLDGLLRPAMN